MTEIMIINKKTGGEGIYETIWNRWGEGRSWYIFKS